MSRKRPSLLSFLIVALAFLAMCAYEGLGPNRDKQKSKEIEQLWADLPVYRDMVPTSSASASGGRKAYKEAYYRSSVPYDDVKRFYVDRLGGHGWVFENEKRRSEWG
jgi:hypothetical protein